MRGWATRERLLDFCRSVPRLPSRIHALSPLMRVDPGECSAPLNFPSLNSRNLAGWRRVFVNGLGPDEWPSVASGPRSKSVGTINKAGLVRPVPARRPWIIMMDGCIGCPAREPQRKGEIGGGPPTGQERVGGKGELHHSPLPSVTSFTHATGFGRLNLEIAAPSQKGESGRATVLCVDLHSEAARGKLQIQRNE
jgi:hypothetical protein